MTDRYFAEKVCNDTFWINKIQEKFNLPIDIINESKGDNTYWAYYLDLLRYDVNEYNFLSNAVGMGRKDLVLLTLVSDEPNGHYYIGDNKLNPYYGRYAATECNLDMLIFLKSLGMDIHDEGIVSVAINYGCFDMVKYLVNDNPRFYTRSDDTLTHAVKYGNKKIVKYLLDHGAMVGRDDFYWSFSSSFRNAKIAALLLRRFYGITDGIVLASIRNLDGFEKKPRKKLRKILNQIKAERGI